MKSVKDFICKKSLRTRHLFGLNSAIITSLHQQRGVAVRVKPVVVVDGMAVDINSVLLANKGRN